MPLNSIPPAQAQTASPRFPEGLLSRFSLDKRQLARRYRVGARTIQNWVSQRRIRFLRIGNILRFDPRACDKALARFAVTESQLDYKPKVRASGTK
jgi:hypothetical protein